MNVGSLFTGIGGFDLGLERAGMRVVWQCESDPYCRGVLRRAWPAVPRYPDVRRLRGLVVRPVDLLCGGFPCQDTSRAGGWGEGIDGTRSGLWVEFARVVCELRPRWVVVENVPAVLDRGAGRVLGDLAACGYDAEWDCVPASAIGAPHRRDRLWIVAYPGGTGLERTGAEGRPGPAAGGAGNGRAWPAEPRVGRVADGIPHRVDRIRGLGNACVPDLAQWLGERIMAWEERTG